MGLLLEKWHPLLAGIAVSISTYNFTPPHVEGMKEVVQSIVNSSAIAIGFLATSLSVLYSIGKTRIIRDLERLGRKKHVVNYFIESMAAWFVLAVISGLLLLIDFKQTDLPRWGQNSLAVMYGVLVWAILSLIRIVVIFRSILNSP